MELHIGDKVRVREWDDLTSEFKREHINNRDVLTTDTGTVVMRGGFMADVLCGNIVEIKDIDSLGFLEVERNHWRFWIPYMDIEPPEQEYFIYDSPELDAFLCSYRS